MSAVSVSRPTEALIVGGGPAGATLGALLAKEGRTVEIIERTSAMHDKVCGEFLSSEAVEYIEHLGVDLHMLGAVPIHGVRLVVGKQVAGCELPFPAMSLSRRTLDEALLTLALSKGATVLRGRRVDSLDPSEPGWVARLSGGETRCAQSAFLATGKHNITGHRRPDGHQNDLVAFKMYFRLETAQGRALRGWVELIVFSGGYAGLQIVENGDANLCLLVTRGALRRCRGDWFLLLGRIRTSSEHLAQRLEGARALLPKPLALSSIPYGLLPAHSVSGLWRLGDQAAVIPSFSGDGMSIALHSAHVAAGIYLGGGTATQLAQRLHKELRRPVMLATVLSKLIIAAPGLARVVCVWPSLLRPIANRTRVSPSALLTEAHRMPLPEL